MGLIPTFTLTGNQEVIIFLIALAYTTIVVFIQRKLSNAKRLRDIQAHVALVSKEMNQMLKNKAPEAEVMAKQKEIMPLLKESMTLSMKPMLVLLPMYAIMLYLIIPAIPLGTSATVSSVRSFFIIVVIGTGLAAAAIMMVYDKQQVKKGEKKLEKEDPAQVEREIKALDKQILAKDK